MIRLVGWLLLGVGAWFAVTVEPPSHGIAVLLCAAGGMGVLAVADQRARDRDRNVAWDRDVRQRREAGWREW